MITLCKREIRKLPQKTGGLGIGFGHEKDADHICGLREGFRKNPEKVWSLEKKNPRNLSVYICPK